MSTLEFERMTEDDQWALFHSVVARSVEVATAGAGRVTLLAKSLGTAAIAVLPEGLVPDNSVAIWLTPIFRTPFVAEGAKRRRWRSLYVYGSADPSHDPAEQAAVVAATGGQSLSIEGGDHALEIPGDVLATVRAAEALAAAVLEFVKND